MKPAAIIAALILLLIPGLAMAQEYPARQVGALCWHRAPSDNPTWQPEWLEMKIYHDMPEWLYQSDEFRLTHSHALFYMVRHNIPDDDPEWYRLVYGELEENYELRPGIRRLVWKESFFIHTQFGGFFSPDAVYGMNQAWVRDWRNEFVPPKVLALKGGGAVDPDSYETSIPVSEGLRQSRGPCTDRSRLLERTYAAPVWTPKPERWIAYPGPYPVPYPGP